MTASVYSFRKKSVMNITLHRCVHVLRKLYHYWSWEWLMIIHTKQVMCRLRCDSFTFINLDLKTSLSTVCFRMDCHPVEKK